MDLNAHAMAVAFAAQSMASHPHHQLQPLLHQTPLMAPQIAPVPAPSHETMMSPAIQPPRRQEPQEPQHLYYQNSSNYVHLEQQINTLFVSGLPDDVKAREIHNLFRRRFGFHSSQLKYTGRGNQVVAFVTFTDHHSAMVAMNALNGATFDPQTGATLHIELARSNSRTKRPRGNGAYTIIDKRVKVPSDAQETWSNDGDGDGGSDEPSGTSNPCSGNKRGLPSAQSGEATGDLVDAKVDGSATLNDHSEKHATGENPKCSTLFIANLGPRCTEEELNQALSRFPGFQRLKLQGRGGMPVAFADFLDVQSATEAMNHLQGTLLTSSDRGGMHLEYARSKMRK